MRRLISSGFSVKGGDFLDATALTQLIGSLGFPIVACIAIFIKDYKDNNRWMDIVQKNTDAITRLADKLEEKDESND